MNKLLCAFALVAGFIVTPVAMADDQSNITFSQGSVLVICAPPEGVELTAEQFNSAFPEWITFLQIKANEGVIARAHYLGELKAGMFMVIEGKDKDDAMKNAQSVIGELNDTFRRVTGSEEADTCNFREIGPVAIMPQ